MNIHWKEIGHRASPAKWSGMVWGVVLMVVICSLGTAWVGVKLYEVTDRQVVYNLH